MLERLWFVAVMAWSGVRIAAVWHFLRDYKVHPLVYAIVDLGSSVPYAIGSARTITSLVDGRLRPAMWWGALTVVSFCAPEAYIVLSGQEMPWGVYALVAVVFSIAAGLAFRAGRSKLAAQRAVTAAALAGAGAGGGAQPTGS